jgi:hypothetical protein
MTKESRDKGESSKQARAATLGLRDGDGRTADPLGCARDDNKERVVGWGETLLNRNMAHPTTRDDKG